MQHTRFHTFFGTYNTLSTYDFVKLVPFGLQTAKDAFAWHLNDRPADCGWWHLPPRFFGPLVHRAYAPEGHAVLTGPVWDPRQQHMQPFGRGASAVADASIGRVGVN